MTLDAITSAKAVQRRAMLARRAVLPVESVVEWSQAILEQALELPELVAGRSAFVYVSVEREVDTRPLIATLLEQGTVVAVPFIAGRGIIEAHCIASLDELTPDRYGIPAPPRPHPLTEPADVCLAPAVALTERGERLGMGGGYYDRYLATHEPGATIALAYEMQIVDTLPLEPVDRRVDAIVTERRVIRCGERATNRPTAPHPPMA